MLRGVILTEGRAASGGRAELFAPGSVVWPSDGIGILTEHRATGEIRVEARATDAIRRAVDVAGRRYMSVEFHAQEERTTAGGVREVLRAMVDAAALVCSPEYDVTSAEIDPAVPRSAPVVALTDAEIHAAADAAVNDYAPRRARRYQRSTPGSPTAGSRMRPSPPTSPSSTTMGEPRPAPRRRWPGPASGPASPASRARTGNAPPRVLAGYRRTGGRGRGQARAFGAADLWPPPARTQDRVRPGRPRARPPRRRETRKQKQGEKPASRRRK